MCRFGKFVNTTCSMYTIIVVASSLLRIVTRQKKKEKKNGSKLILFAASDYCKIVCIAKVTLISSNDNDC